VQRKKNKEQKLLQTPVSVLSVLSVSDSLTDKTDTHLNKFFVLEVGDADSPFIVACL
jgi:hypothetical protein